MRQLREAEKEQKRQALLELQKQKEKENYLKNKNKIHVQQFLEAGQNCLEDKIFERTNLRDDLLRKIFS